jgi:hypothetical protein
MYQFTLMSIQPTHYILKIIIILKRIDSKQSNSVEGRVLFQARENDNDSSLTQSQEINISTLF